MTLVLISCEKCGRAIGVIEETAFGRQKIFVLCEKCSKKKAKDVLGGIS